MPVPQPRAVINLLLVLVCGVGGWFLGVYTKQAPARKQTGPAVFTGTQRAQPGIFATDASRLLTTEDAGTREFDELLTRYGSGSRELALLAGPLLEKWAAQDPAAALRDGLPRCREHAPDVMPRAVGFLASQKTADVTALLAALPEGPLRALCLAAAAEAWGRTAREEALAQTGPFSRQERSLFLREWHRGSASIDPAAAGKSAAARPDPDDRESALAGCLLARAVTDPETALREAFARPDFLEIADVAFRWWLARSPEGGWNFAASFKGDSRAAGMVTALLQAETGRRHLSDSIPEITTLLTRVFPGGHPPEVLASLLAILASDRTPAATKFAESQQKSPSQRRHPASILLFDTLCTTDPAAAWRLAELLVQSPGAKDARAEHHWASPAARAAATPQQRLDAGFPDLTDMTRLALHWLEIDRAAAVSAYCAPGVAPPLQSLIVAAALHPAGAAIPKTELLDWAQQQPPGLLQAIEAATGK